jgi:hypothetical protein
MARVSRKFNVGDIIRTHPVDGFWGCAIVLTTFPPTDDFHAMCHIGITPITIQKEFTWGDLADTKLSILELEQHVRLDAYQYRSRIVTCIGVYANYRVPPLPVIGSIDPLTAYPLALRFEVGDGRNGTFPLCGPVRESLGMEAVIAWRRVNDKETWDAEVAHSRLEFEALETRRLADARAKRKVRRGAGT